MDAKERQLAQEKTERQLDESKARIDMLEARARRAEAAGAMAEVSGLRAMHDGVRKQFRQWKEADEASAAELGDAAKRGADALSRGNDAAADRFDRFCDATDRWYDAETDHLAAAFGTFDAWLGEEWVDDKQAAEGARGELRSEWKDVSAKRDALKATSKDKKDEARHALKESLGRMNSKLLAIGARLRRPAEKPAARRP